MSTPSDGPIPTDGRPLPTAATAAPATPVAPPDPRRWWGLVVIALAQLMVVLDATIVNIALPSAQRDLGMSDGNRQWVITAYTLAFGGLLLLGGRIADLVGRKRTFVIGLIGFAGASALGGAAAGPGMLFGARALQGIFAAVLSPSALSLLTTTFTDPKERGKAFGIYGAMAGGGSAIGLLAGGLLTEYLNWRWCLYVNVPIALIAVLGGLTMLRDRPGHAGARLDVPGVLLGCGGLVALVYACSEAEPRGWTDPLVLTLFAVAVVLLSAFVWWQKRAPKPLLPLHILRDRNRAGCFLTMGLATIGMFAVFLFLTYYMQLVLGYSPIRTGLAFLPMTAAIITGSTQVAARLLHHVPPRALMAPGMLTAALGLTLLTRLTPDGGYASHVLPGMLLAGFGMGLTFMPVFATATAGIAPQDAGVTSATVNTAQQVGGSIGTALLNTIATTTTTTYVATHLRDPADRAEVVREGVVHGFTVAIWWAAGIILLGSLVAALMVTARAPKHTPSEPPPGAALGPGPPPGLGPGPAPGLGSGLGSGPASGPGPGAGPDTSPRPGPTRSP
ncbi:MFS transporter [Streptomyces sp. NPDC002851]